MSGYKWSRDAAVEELRPQLWRYLSPAGRFDLGPATNLELKLDRAELVRLYATHLALSEMTQNALTAAQYLLRHMPSSVALQSVELAGEVRGLVNWQRTHALRVATADPTLFVCTPPERRYDTPLGRLIAATLRYISRLAGQSRLERDKGQVGAAVHATSDQARRLLLDPKLSKLQARRQVSLRNLDGLVARRPQVADLVQFVRKYVSGIIEGDSARLIELLESQFLAPAQESSLFELQVGFAILDVLESCGFVIEPPLPLIPGGTAPFATLRRGDATAVVYWQRSAWVLAPKAVKSGEWWKVLEANKLSKQPLRPDFIVEMPEMAQRFLVEVKLTGLVDRSPDRDGIRDALAYLVDAKQLFQDYPLPHALVVAWNSSAVELRESAIRIVSQTTLRSTLESIIASTIGDS